MVVAAHASDHEETGMTDKPACTAITEKFLEFAARHLPLADAKLATTRVADSAIWQGFNIPKQHGYIIARGQASTDVIRDGKYNCHSTLKTFPQALNGQLGSEGAYVDLFHVDLRHGSITVSFKDVQPIMPMVAASHGKCLAVTMSDQRCPAINEEERRRHDKIRKLIGYERCEVLHKRLHTDKYLSPRDLHPSVNREFIALLDIFALLQLDAPHPPYWIESMERHTYYENHPLHRMRCCFFHLSTTPPELSQADIIDRQLATWYDSHLVYTDQKGVSQRINPPQMTPEEQTMIVTDAQPNTVTPQGSPTEEESQLHKLVELMGNPRIKAEYQALLDGQAELLEVRSELETAKTALARVRQVISTAIAAIAPEQVSNL